MSEGQAPEQQRPVASPPAGSKAQSGGAEVYYAGGVRHTANLVNYLKWMGFSVVGGVLAWALRMIPAIRDGNAPVWVLAMIGLPPLIWSFLFQATKKVKVDSRRVETEKGVIARTVDSLELWRVLDVQYKQGVLDRITGDAKLILIGTDQTDPELVLHGLPDHRAIFEKLRDAVQDARQTNRPMELVPGQEHGGGADGVFGEFQ